MVLPKKKIVGIGNPGGYSPGFGPPGATAKIFGQDMGTSNR